MPFFWKWDEIVIFLAVTILTYGVVQSLRLFAPGDEWTWTRWWGYKIGDLAVAFYFGYVAVCFHHHMPDGWFANPLFWVPLVIVCVVGSFMLQHAIVASGGMSEEVNAMWSERYHTFMRGVLFGFGLQALIAMIWDSREPSWALNLALFSIFIYVLMFAVVDTLFNDRSMVTRGNR